MAVYRSDVDVDISDVAIISVLNKPGGGVFRWRDDVATSTVHWAQVYAPVNDILNMRHRAGVPGGYKGSFGFDRQGSNGHRVRATIYNSQEYADVVERGRSGSEIPQYFSWTGNKPPGSIRWREGTRSRQGQHVLRRAVDQAVFGQLTSVR